MILLQNISRWLVPNKIKYHLQAAQIKVPEQACEGKLMIQTPFSMKSMEEPNRRQKQQHPLRTNSNFKKTMTGTFPPLRHFQGKDLRQHRRNPTRISMTSLTNCLMILKKRSPKHYNDRRLLIMNHHCGLLDVQKQTFTRQTIWTYQMKVTRLLKVR